MARGQMALFRPGGGKCPSSRAAGHIKSRKALYSGFWRIVSYLREGVCVDGWRGGERENNGGRPEGSSYNGDTVAKSRGTK